MISLRKVSCIAIALTLISGCAGNWQPRPVDDVAFLERAQTVVEDDITVTAAVPSADEAKVIFGANLYKRGVQPVWLDITNNSGEAVAFMPFALDAEYFTPLETASMHDRRKFRSEMEQYFFDSGLNTVVEPGQRRKGFVFSHLDEGTKAFNVDLVGATIDWRNTFFIPVPGLAVDHYEVDFAGLYSEEEVLELTSAELIAQFESFTCCTANAKNTDTGDPLNIAVVGQPKDVYYAFIRAGWDETEVVNAASGLQMAISFFSGGEYRYSPVSSLYVFGRRQDVALQKARGNIHERNHLRLWMTPWRYEGTPVWIGQISRDIGVRFTRKTITTHKIDPDVDETREFLLENLAYNQVLEKFAYVGGAVEAPLESPRQNLTGDPYFTDGQRVLLFISSAPVPLDAVQVVDLGASAQ